MSEFSDLIKKDDLPELFPMHTYSTGVPWWDTIPKLDTTPIQLDPISLDKVVDGQLDDDMLVGIEDELDELDHVETDPDTDAEIDDLTPAQRARQLVKVEKRLHELKLQTCRIRDEQDRLSWRVKYLQDSI